MPLPRMQKSIHKKYDLCRTNNNPLILIQMLQRLLTQHFSPLPYLVSFKSVFSNIRKVGSITHEGHINRAIDQNIFQRNFLKVAKTIPDPRSCLRHSNKNGRQLNFFLMYGIFTIFMYDSSLLSFKNFAPHQIYFKNFQ